MADPGPGEDPSLGPGQRSAGGGRHFADPSRRRSPADGSDDDRSVPWREEERQAAERAIEERRRAEALELERLSAERQAAIDRAVADERAAFAEDAARSERSMADRDSIERELPEEDPFADRDELPRRQTLDGASAAAFDVGSLDDGGRDRERLEAGDRLETEGEYGPEGHDPYEVSGQGYSTRSDSMGSAPLDPDDDSLRSFRSGGGSLGAAERGGSSSSGVRRGTIDVATKLPTEIDSAEAPTTSKLGWLLTILLVGLALGLAWTLFRIAGGGGDDENAAESEVAAETELEAESDRPALEIFPQRAVARPSLTVQAQGGGCAANSIGILTVRAVDDGLADPAGRLIGQHVVRVGKTGNWSSTPQLVDKPAGTYWLTMTCARGDGADSVAAALQGKSLGDAVEVLRTSDPQQVLEATQVLELTGPVKVLAINLTPEIAVAGTPTNVLLQGEACPGNRVDIVATGPNGERGTYEATVDRDGAWNLSVPLPAATNVGSYRFVSRCDTGAQYATRTVAFVAERVPTVRDVTTSGTVSVSTPTLQGIPLAQPATPIPADANFTG